MGGCDRNARLLAAGGRARDAADALPGRPGAGSGRAGRDRLDAAVHRVAAAPAGAGAERRAAAGPDRHARGPGQARPADRHPAHPRGRAGGAASREQTDPLRRRGREPVGRDHGAHQRGPAGVALDPGFARSDPAPGRLARAPRPRIRSSARSGCTSACAWRPIWGSRSWPMSGSRWRSGRPAAAWSPRARERACSTGWSGCASGSCSTSCRCSASRSRCSRRSRWSSPRPRRAPWSCR